MQQLPTNVKRYIPAVDGLRALGVLTVLFYHLRLPFAKSGLLGVTVFFVLSGYLVTRLLLTEADRTGRVDMKDFWKRRGRRIMPVMVAMILVMTIVYAIRDPFLLNKMRPDIVPSILIFNNWWQIIRDVSYFAAQGAPSPLTHYWSLAIEGQFYLVWPLVIMLFTRRRRGDLFQLSSPYESEDGTVMLPAGRWRILAIVTAALAITSAVLLAVYFDPTADASRAYYGTDSRCFSLLGGALLAIYEAEGGMQKKSHASVNIGGHPFLLTDVVGMASLVIILVIAGVVRGSSPFLYRGGQQLVTLLTMALLYAALQHGSIVSRVWSWKPLVGIGKISYSLYIWHYPVVDLISGVRRASFGTTMLEIGLSFLLAILGYYLIETPCRHGALGKMCHNIATIIRRIKSNKAARGGDDYDDDFVEKVPVLQGSPARSIIMFALALLLILSSVFCTLFGPSLNKNGKHKGPALVHQLEMQAREQQQRVKNEEAIKAQGDASKEDGKSDSKSGTQETAKSYKDYNYLLIGDSVALTAAKDLNKAFPNMIVDAVNSRMSYETADIMDDYLKKGWDGKAVIFALSTNGPITDELDTIREKIGPDKQIFIINARAPYDEFPDQNNKLIAKFVENDPEAYLIDWYSTSNPHESWFDGDGTHMNAKGNKHYVEVIDEVLASVYGE